MKTSSAIVLGTTAGLLVVVPLVLLWYTRRKAPSDRMDERQVVKKKKEKLVKTTKVQKEDVRFIIGRGGCVIRDIESRCSVKILFPEDEDTDEHEQIVSIKGDCKDDITEAMEMIKEACQLKPVILTETIEILAEYCGKIIGKGGDNLRDIRDKSGTRIQIGKEPVPGNEQFRTCQIMGTKEEIETAKQLLHEEIMVGIDIKKRREDRQAVKIVMDDGISESFEVMSEDVNPLEIVECEDVVSDDDISTITTQPFSVSYDPVPYDPVSYDPVSDDPESGESKTPEPAEIDYNTGISDESDFTTMSSDLAEVCPSLTSKESYGFSLNSSDGSDKPSQQSLDKVRYDLPIDEDVSEVTLSARPDNDPVSPLLDPCCLPPLAPPHDIESDSVETLVPGTPPSSMLCSNGSNTSTTTEQPNTLVNKKMTHDLKSMLGLPPGEEEDTALYNCHIYNYLSARETQVKDEFKAVVNSALCSCHIIIVDRSSSTFNSIRQLLSAADLNKDPVTNPVQNSMYLFVDKSAETTSRVMVLENWTLTTAECYDVDTGLKFCVPTECLLQITQQLKDIPPAAVCVSVGSGHCKDVFNTEITGKLVTVSRDQSAAVMGANKDIKYPRVKIHREQIVYNNYRSYVTSPKHTETATLPTGSSLVYVSAIHNAGHFYVQVCGKNISELDRLEREMAQFYGSVDNPPEHAWEPVPGQLCGVWHTQEQIWLRGQVKELGNSDMLYIKYLDYGDTVHLPRSYTRKLRSEFEELPYQAIECFLANTIPITTRQWTPDATAKFDALTQCGQWYPLRCVVVGERHGKPCVELYDQPYSDKEYSVADCLCTMEFARSSKMEVPIVQTLSTPIPSFASGAAYLVSPDFDDDVDDELEELFACDDDTDGDDSDDDFPISRANVSTLLMSLGSQLSPAHWKNKKNSTKYRPQTCGTAKNNAFMEKRTESVPESSEETTPKPQRKTRFSTQDSLSDCDSASVSDQSQLYETPMSNSPKSTTSSYCSAAEFNNTFVTPLETPEQAPVTPLHLSNAEDTDSG